MLVKVKDGCSVFYDKLHTEGVEFEIVERLHSVKKGANGQPEVISEESQFSETSMIRVSQKPKVKSQPKVKAKQEAK